MTDWPATATKAREIDAQHLELEVTVRGKTERGVVDTRNADTLVDSCTVIAMQFPDAASQNVALPELVKAADPNDFLRARSPNGRLAAIESNGHVAAKNVVPWQTAAELSTEVPEAIEFLWQDFLAYGTVVELDAKLKTGKTTFVGLLLRSILEERPFLGRRVQRCPVVYLTEEGARTFRALLARSHLVQRNDLHVLSRRRVPDLTWPQLVATARDKVLATGARLVVVDTLSKLAGFQDDAENVSGAAMAAMTPLQALASELNIVVLVLRHDRKSGGEVGESARGSSAMGGDVDVIIQLTRVGGEGHERQRYLKTLSRFDETPAELTIELVDGAYREALSAPEAAAQAVLAMLPDTDGEGVAVVDLLPELQNDGHKRASVYDGVKQLKAAGRVTSTIERGPTGRKREVIGRAVVQTTPVALDDRVLNTSDSPDADRSGRPHDSGPPAVVQRAPFKGRVDECRSVVSELSDDPLPEGASAPLDEPKTSPEDDYPPEWSRELQPDDPSAVEPVEARP